MGKRTTGGGIYGADWEFPASYCQMLRFVQTFAFFWTVYFMVINSCVHDFRTFLATE